MNSSFGHDHAHHVRKLVDTVPSMLAYWDRHLRCRFANRAYITWFGVDPDDLIGRSLHDLLGPALFALNEPYIKGVLEGTQQVFERIVPGPDGTKRHSLASYIPDIVDGEVNGFVAHVTDITPLKETEAALRAEVARREFALKQLRERTDRLLQAERLGGVGSWEWEVEPDITTWSAELYRIFGRDPGRLPPTFAEHPTLYTYDSWARLQAAVSLALSAGLPYELELEYVRKDGQSGWLEARGEAVRGELGNIIKLRGTVHEVTVRHQAEVARTQTLAADAASRNKTELMSRVSHELKTPLNAVLGFSHLLERDASLNHKQHRWANSMTTAGKHMLKLVEELLDMSAAEAGRIELDSLDFDPAPIVGVSILHLSGTALTSGIALHGLDAACEPVLVRGDAGRFKQVMDNLLSNAVKYTAAGGSVCVTRSVLDSEVEIAVQDTGQGLTAGEVDRLFKPFERLGKELTAIPGTGLGLALSKTLVELMGGRIRVESVPSQGSIFTVSLPRGVGANLNLTPDL